MPLLRLWNSIRSRCGKRHKPAGEDLSKHAVTSGNSRFKLFGGGPHSGLCKLIKSVPAASRVLEISVDDGSRAIAIMQTVMKTQEHADYLAIDQFELGDSSVTLKQFHQQLRAQKIRPKLIPDTIPRGLIRVARTVGQVDLVVIAAPVDRWRTQTTLPLLARICHSKTVVLFLEEDTWRQFDGAGPAHLQRAA